jgi:hypothetical protein
MARSCRDQSVTTLRARGGFGGAGRSRPPPIPPTILRQVERQTETTSPAVRGSFTSEKENPNGGTERRRRSIKVEGITRRARRQNVEGSTSSQQHTAPQFEATGAVKRSHPVQVRLALLPGWKAEGRGSAGNPHIWFADRSSSSVLLFGSS